MASPHDPTGDCSLDGLRTLRDQLYAAVAHVEADIDREHGRLRDERMALYLERERLARQEQQERWRLEAADASAKRAGLDKMKLRLKRAAPKPDRHAA